MTEHRPKHLREDTGDLTNYMGQFPPKQEEPAPQDVDITAVLRLRPERVVGSAPIPAPQSPDQRKWRVGIFGAVIALIVAAYCGLVLWAAYKGWGAK